MNKTILLLKKLKYQFVQDIDDPDIKNSLTYLTNNYSIKDRNLMAKVIEQKIEYSEEDSENISFTTNLSFAYCIFLNNNNDITDAFCISLYPTMYRTAKDVESAKEIIENFGEESEYIRNKIEGDEQECLEA